jgi:hypothetical protein
LLRDFDLCRSRDDYLASNRVPKSNTSNFVPLQRVLSDGCWTGLIAVAFPEISPNLPVLPIVDVPAMDTTSPLPMVRLMQAAAFARTGRIDSLTNNNTEPYIPKAGKVDAFDIVVVNFGLHDQHNERDYLSKTD